MTIANQHSDPLFDAPPHEAADFVADMCEGLCTIAENAGHRYLSYVLELARQEAQKRAGRIGVETVSLAPEAVAA